MTLHGLDVLFRSHTTGRSHMEYDVGFIGLGQMGMPMVENLSKAGFRILAYARRDEVAQAARQFDGVDVVNSCRELAEKTPIIFTCLTNLEAIQAVYFGQDGILVGGHPGLITCDCSTIPPEDAKMISAQLRSEKIDHFEAPIFGTPEQAEALDLFLAVSGNASDRYQELGSLMDAMTRSHSFVGSSGAAYAIKLLQNGLGNSYAVLTGEIFALCRSLGVDVDAFISVIREADALGWSNYLERYAEAAAHDLDTGGGRMFICAKDAEYVHGLAIDSGIKAPILEAAAKTFATAMANGWENDQFTSVGRVAAGAKPLADG